MIKIHVLKLGITCSDKATTLEGMLTHLLINMEEQIEYVFQPRGLNDEGQPVPKLMLEAARLTVTENDFEDLDIPFEILGTDVTDKASGFTGMAVGFVRHINGCLHVLIQPPGKLSKTNNPIKKAEFDLRQCTGPKIIELDEQQLAESKKKNPSPTSDHGEKYMPGSGQIVHQ